MGGYAAESEAARICANLGLPDRVLAQPLRHPVRRSAPPHRAGPHPVLRRRDAAARRADQPPRRRLDHLAARLPRRPQGRPDRDQPRRRAARGGRQQGVVPRRQPGHRRHLQPGLEGVPGAARDRRAAPQAGAGQHRAEGRHAERPGRQDAGQGHQGQGREEHGQARREAGRRPGRRPGAGQGGQGALPDPGRRAARRRSPRRACPRRTARWRSSPTSTSRWTGARGSSSSGSTAPARRRCCGCWPAPSCPTPARSSRGTACGWATTPRSTRRIDMDRTLLEDMRSAAPDSTDTELRTHPRRVPLLRGDGRPAGRARSPAASRPGWRWPRWSSPAPTCCCSTSRPTTSTRPAGSRCSRRCAPTRARSCWSPTTRARCARSTRTRSILLPDGAEDSWSEDFADLVSLA